MVNCKICGNNGWEIAYKGKIRIGGLGNLSENECTVFRCKYCSVQWLPSIVEDRETYYCTDEYRKDVGQSSDIKEYEKRHDPEVNYQLDILPIEFYRDKVVVDIGCGGGSFLDAISGFAKKTIAIEINKDLLSQLNEKGHITYSTLEELINNLDSHIDVVLAQSLIEHLADPLLFMQQVKSVLDIGGVAIITTPNTRDFLLEEGPEEYKSFFYRKAHEWYFNETSLKKVFYNVNFSKIQVKYQHSYTLSNALLWLRDRKGYGRIDIINEQLCDLSWKIFLEKTGQAERIIFIAS